MAAGVSVVRRLVTLLVSATQLAQRRIDARGPLMPLADSLRADLAPLLATLPDIPTDKAMLSRDGGRCPRDGTQLAFDPFAPHRHRCPTCGEIYAGERHDRWWIMSYQLWLAERAVHAAVLHALRPEPALAALAAHILSGYADRYLDYPNRDNVLGPTRPFFSTYLESIWMLQLAVALDLLEASGSAGDLGGRVRERVLEPSAAIIASYDEGASNRQVWNNAALLSAYRLLGRVDQAARVVTGRSGLLTHLQHGLLSDGSWYEGENYHFFAHRGLWYGVALAAQAAIDVPGSLLARFDEGFAAPLATLLPDYTFPSRRDSAYAVSLRQWRFAESFELGLARLGDARLVGALAELYRPQAQAGETGRWRSTAEAERNEPASPLTRADLGWRSLLAARATLPALEPSAPASVLMEGQGIAILRRESGRTYVGLDYGHSGGGHGHADRLNLLLVRGATRWLDDFGTGSYVDASLFWYRSTLAHDAPLVGGRSQERAHGVLRAWDERESFGWVEAEVPLGGLAPNARVSRTLIVTPTYLLDEVRFTSATETTFDLPLHAATGVAGVAWEQATIGGSRESSDGFGYLRDTAAALMRAGVSYPLELRIADGRGWTLADRDGAWWHAIAPGAPGHGDERFVMLRTGGPEAIVRTLWSWGVALGLAVLDDRVVVALEGGERHEHARTELGWRIDEHGAGGVRRTDLGGRRVVPPLSPPRAHAPRGDVHLIPHLAAGEPVREGVVFRLGHDHYRRSEESWHEAGSPTAEVVIAAAGAELQVLAVVQKSPVVFRPAHAPDPELDNEVADIHSDGVQLHVWAPHWSSPAGWLAIPQDDGTVRLSTVTGSWPGIIARAAWERDDDGYTIALALPLAAFGAADPYDVYLDVLVNDMAPERQRRRGQLVLSGGRGDFVYLQGDRQSPSSYLHFIVTPDA